MKPFNVRMLVTGPMYAALFAVIGGGAVAGQLANGRKIVKQVVAQYPSVLKSRGIGGTVHLKVLVKADGSVKSTEVSGGSPILAAASQTAVLQWKFTPAASDSVIDVSIVFGPKSQDAR